MSKRKKEKELTFTDPLDSDDPDTIEGLSEKPDVEEFSGIDKIEKDSEYSEHTNKIESEDKTDEEPKTDEKTSEKDKEE